jgi:hypothetical protein
VLLLSSKYRHPSTRIATAGVRRGSPWREPPTLAVDNATMTAILAPDAAADPDVMDAVDAVAR